MKISLVKEDDTIYALEDERKIYCFEESKEQRLITVVLKNMYGEEVRAMYQIQRSPLKYFSKKHKGYTFYDHDDKLGELHYTKEGFEIKFHDIYYRFYGGLHANKKTVLCFDRDVEIAEFTLGEQPYVKFRNTNLNAGFTILLYLFNYLLPFEQFDEKVYLHSYKGMIEDRYEFQK